jgi:uncharacterized protein YvpB
MKRFIAGLVAIVVLGGAAWLALRREPPAPPQSPPFTGEGRGGAEQTLLLDVIGQPQSYNLSCESRSASDLARFWGYDVPESEFLNRLPRADNPHRGFVGSPGDPRGSLPPRGYGVYAEPVAALLKKYGLPARAEFGRDLDWLRQELAAGRPIIVWTTYDFKPRPIQSFKDSRGQEFEAVPFEHTYLIVGYTAQGLYAIDAYDGQRKFYTTAEFEAGWKQLGQMAVAVDDPRAVARARSNTASGLLRTFGVPVLAVGLLAAAYVTWRNGGRLPATRPRRKLGYRVPRQSQVGAIGSSAFQRFQTALVGALEGRPPSPPAPLPGGETSPPAPLPRGERGRAQTLGIVGLATGVLLALGLGGFNPCLAVPLVAGCGALGFILGYQLERRGR